MPKMKTKKDPIIVSRALIWPEDKPRTPPEARELGRFRLKNAALQGAEKALRALLKKMNVPRASVMWVLPAANEALRLAADPAYPHPEVAIEYHWRGEDHWIGCDRFNTVVGNLRNITTTISALSSMLESRSVHRFQTEMQRFTSAMAVRQVQKMPSKAGLNPETEWQQILDLHASDIDSRLGLPRNSDIVRQRRTELQLKYHPDKPTAPDVESSSVINMAAAYVIDAVDRLQRDLEARSKHSARAAQEAEERKRARQAKVMAGDDNEDENDETMTACTDQEDDEEEEDMEDRDLVDDFEGATIATDDNDDIEDEDEEFVDGDIDETIEEDESIEAFDESDDEEDEDAIY